MSYRIMLEECYDGSAPGVVWHCDCNPPHEQTRMSHALDADIRTITASCNFCGAEETFVYERQEDGSWCMIDD